MRPLPPTLAILLVLAAGAACAEVVVERGGRPLEVVLDEVQRDSGIDIELQQPLTEPTNASDLHARDWHHAIRELLRDHEWIGYWYPDGTLERVFVLGPGGAASALPPRYGPAVRRAALATRAPRDLVVEHEADGDDEDLDDEDFDDEDFEDEDFEEDPDEEDLADDLELSPDGGPPAWVTRLNAESESDE